MKKTLRFITIISLNLLVLIGCQQHDNLLTLEEIKEIQIFETI